MTAERKAATAFGVLLLAAIVCGVFSSVQTIEEAGYLARLTSIESRILTAIFFQALMALIYVGIVVMTYPLVRLDSEGGATAYLMLRSIGAAFLFVGIVTLSLFTVLGRHYAQAEPSQLEEFELIGSLLRHARDGLNHIGMILPWCIGSLFLYRAFLRTKLIPRWLAVGGLCGAVLTLLATTLYMLDQVELLSVTYLTLNVPTALLEVVLALYLITRGFREGSLEAIPTFPQPNQPLRE